MGARVVALVRYLIKGCAAEPVDRITAGPMGLADDRLFMVVDQNGKYITQRTVPKMAVIRPKLRDGRLVLAGPDMPEREFDIVPDGERLEVVLHKWEGKAVDQGAEPAAWLSEYMGEPCRLVRVPPDLERRSNGVAGGMVGFADADAIHVTSLASLDHLNELIMAKGGDALPMNRFRPNVVVSGWSEPYTEDTVDRMTIGPVELAFEKKAIRCAVPTIDQAVGVKAGHEPTRTLATYRREEGGGVSFGTKYAVIKPGELAVGDPVTVISSSDR